jgi:hypothetical protein
MCIVEDKGQLVTCIVEGNKLKIVEAVTILEAQPVSFLIHCGSAQDARCEDG